MDDQADIQAVIDHVGIDTFTASHNDTIMSLMNFTLQCLGTIRLMIIDRECKREAVNANNIVSTPSNSVKSTYLAETFSLAVKCMLESIVNGTELNDLDPVRHLLESFPNATTISSKEWCAMHWLVAAGDKLDDRLSVTAASKQYTMVKTLSESFPDLYKELDKEHRTVLHYASRLNSDCVDLVNLVSHHSLKPHGLGIEFANLNGAIPIHNASRFCKSYAIYDAIYSLNPAAISQVNNEGMLPLHWAAAKNTSIEIVESLILRSAPDAIRVANSEGYLPIHCSGQNQCLDVVQLIYHKYPHGIKVVDNEGGYPLHHACCFNKNVEVIKFMYQNFPDAMSIPQFFEGLLPLHLAAAQNSSWKVMEFLLERMPCSAFMVDMDGWLAIHGLLDNLSHQFLTDRIICLRLLLKLNPKCLLLSCNHIKTWKALERQYDQQPETIDESTYIPSKAATKYAEAQLEYFMIPPVLSPYSKAVSKNHGPLTLRLILNANPSQNMDVYHQLNWNARKMAIMLVIALTKKTHSKSMNELKGMEMDRIHVGKSWSNDLDTAQNTGKRERSLSELNHETYEMFHCVDGKSYNAVQDGINTSSSNEINNNISQVTMKCKRKKLFHPTEQSINNRKENLLKRSNTIDYFDDFHFDHNVECLHSDEVSDTQSKDFHVWKLLCEKFMDGSNKIPIGLIRTIVKYL